MAIGKKSLLGHWSREGGEDMVSTKANLMRPQATRTSYLYP